MEILEAGAALLAPLALLAEALLGPRIGSQPFFASFLLLQSPAAAAAAAAAAALALV